MHGVSAFEQEIVVVTGLPRSGTTCMMRMLEAGGVPPYYDQSMPLEFSEKGTHFINYNIILRETDKLNDLHEGDGSWLKECKGMAVKILTPTEVEIPRGYLYRFIWMDRKIKHMAKSQHKWLKRNARDIRNRHLALSNDDVHNPDMEVLQDRLRDARARGMALLREYPDSRMTIIKFEDMLRNPRGAALAVRIFLGVDMDIDRMAEVVVKRPAANYPGMLEEQIYV